MRVVVLGAGIIGVTMAYLLARDGHRVRVLDRAEGPGLGCSYANGGQLSFSYSDALASPALLRRLPGLLLASESPMAVRPRALPGLGRWGLRFLRNCTRRRWLANTLQVLRLGLYSRAVLHRLPVLSRLDFDYARNGKLHVYASPAELERARRLVAHKNRLGCAQEVLDAGACRTREPALEGMGERLFGGVYSPLDESGDTLRLTRGLAAICAGELDAVFDYGCRAHGLVARRGRVVAVRTERGEVAGEAFVVCLGADSPRVCRGIGLRLPICPAKGYSVTVPVGPRPPCAGITDTAARVVYSRLGERLRVAGILDLEGYRSAPRPERTEGLLRRGRAVLPDAGDWDRVLDTWAGLRPLTPDGVPILGRGPYPNLYLNTGHGMLGATLSFGSAALVSDLIAGRTPAIETSGLAYDRGLPPIRPAPAS